MTFLRYKGGMKAGRWTKGKIYPAHDALEGKASSHTTFTVRDDYGGEFSLGYKDGYFDVQEGIYICCLKRIAGMEPGEVYLVNSGNDDSFEIAGVGWFNANSFEIVDATNFAVGSYVQDISTGRWLPVLDMTDDCQVLVDRDDQPRPLSDFMLPLAEGGIATVPLAKCIDATGTTLTKDREYLILHENGMITVQDEHGKSQTLDVKRFIKK